MKYLEFCNRIKEEVENMVEPESKVRLEQVVKNNHIVRQALIIVEQERNIFPSIYLEKYYTDYMNGQNINDICQEIIACYDQYKDGIQFDVNKYLDYETVREQIFIKVVNAKKNMESLQNAPWMECYDLAITAYVLVEDSTNSRATININNDNLKMWNIDKDKLFKDAIFNTRKLMICKLEKLSYVMRELLEEKVNDIHIDSNMDEDLNKALEMFEASDEEKIYVLTNQFKNNGAVFMAFDDILKNVAKKINDNFYILPSSIHELLIVPKSNNISKSELEKMVREINQTEVDPKEVLSDTVYEYHRDKGIIW